MRRKKYSDGLFWASLRLDKKDQQKVSKPLEKKPGSKTLSPASVLITLV